MKFTLLLTLGFALFTSSVAAAVAVEAREVCTCTKVSDPGLYCGYCLEVTSCHNENNCYKNAYECNKQGGCHSYGKSDRCKWPLVGPRMCDGRDVW